MKLSTDERKHLASLQDKLTHIGDAVNGVIKHFHTGLFLYGEGGTGKSFKVIESLRAAKCGYMYHNARLTARGLVDALQRAPTDIHLIEDAETLMDDRKTFGVLRSALWSQSRQKPPEREITWTAFKTEVRFIFTGGIIVVSNANLAADIPEIRAIKTRINVLQLDLSKEELLALMKHLCLQGYQYGEDYMSPNECLQVGEFIRERLEGLQRSLDLRLLMNGFKDFLQWKTKNSVNHWHDLLLGRIQERPVVVRRAERVAKESKIANEINDMKIPYKKKIELWEQRTGHKGERSYYRALQRLEKKGQPASP
jgi:hypothetical protein